MAERVTVLLTCAGGQLATQTIAHLQRASTIRPRVVAVDVVEDAIGRVAADSFHVVPRGDDPMYVDAMLTVCEKEHVDVVIPGADEEALALASAGTAFHAAGIASSAPPAELVDVLRDKGTVFDWLREREVPLPAYARVRFPDELESAAAALGYPERPVVVKPAVARGGRGVWLVRADGPNASELFGGIALDVITLSTLTRAVSASSSFPELLMMQWLDGDVYDVDVLTDGAVLHALIPRRRLHPRTNPFPGGVVEPNQAVLDLADRVRSQLDMHALYDLDIMLDADGHPWLLEINPRLSASAVVSMEAGVPLVEMLVRMLLGLEVAEVDPRYGVRVRPYISLHTDRSE